MAPAAIGLIFYAFVEVTVRDRNGIADLKPGEASPGGTIT
jgi:hypothetical protein